MVKKVKLCRINCVIWFEIFNFSGLKTAKLTTKALYEGTVAGLESLKAEQIAEIFQGATVVELLPEPGQSVLDLGMKAQCFSRIGNAYWEIFRPKNKKI